jgi:hypothetical protein
MLRIFTLKLILFICHFKPLLNSFVIFLLVKKLNGEFYPNINLVHLFYTCVHMADQKQILCICETLVDEVPKSL